jgi:hypothetical protein
VTGPATRPGLRDPAPLTPQAHGQVRRRYGSVIGATPAEPVMPALVLDRDILDTHLTRMEAALTALHARLRGHHKNHRSPHVARLQLEHGAFGLCTATIREAFVMASAGAGDVVRGGRGVGISPAMPGGSLDGGLLAQPEAGP